MKLLSLLIFFIFSFNLMALTPLFIEHDISVELYPEDEQLFLRDIIKGYSLYLDSITIPTNVKSLVFKCDNQKVDYVIVSRDLVKTKVLLSIGRYGCESLEVRYLFAPKTKYNGVEHPALILSQGVYLAPSSYWYPQNGAKFERYKLEVSLPKEWSTMTIGVLTYSQVFNDLKIEKWLVNNNAEPLFLIANRFDIQRVNYRGISIETYFHKDVSQFSGQYIDKLKGIVDIYLDYFGHYPYEKFSVVSNFFSTGYGMASYTLLDKNIIPFPFIISRSLGHEFLHNYWGNSVYVKEEEGNWCEGLTSFQADYHYAELDGGNSAYSYRKNELRDYQNSVNLSNVFPLKDFKSRFDSASKSIGYGKSLMVFHMLKNRLGAGVFDRAITRFAKEFKFKSAGWSDIRRVLEEESGIDLESFFYNWIEKSDILDLKLELGSNRLTIIQKGDTVFDALIPVEIRYGRRRVIQIFNISNRVETFELKYKPTEVILDPYFDLMRVLTDKENAPTLKKFWGQENINYYFSFKMSKEKEGILKESIKAHPLNRKVNLKHINLDEKNKLLPGSYYFITPRQLESFNVKKAIGREEFLILNGSINIAGDRFSLRDHVIVIAASIDGTTSIVQSGPLGKSISLICRKVSHYGSYGVLVFNLAGKKVADIRW